MGDEDDDNPFEMEAGAHERVSKDTLSQYMSQGMYIEQKGKKEKLNPEDRFIKTTNAIARNIIERGLGLTQDDIIQILDKTRLITNVRYKNPKAFILGYMAYGGHNELNKKTVLRVIKDVLPEIEENDDVSPEDVLRYARFWAKN